MKVKLLREARIRHYPGEIVEVSPAEAGFLLSTGSAVEVHETPEDRKVKETPEAEVQPKETPEDRKVKETPEAEVQPKETPEAKNKPKSTRTRK